MEPLKPVRGYPFPALWGQLTGELQDFLRWLQLRYRIADIDLEKLVRLIVRYGDLCYQNGYDSCFDDQEIEEDEAEW